MDRPGVWQRIKAFTRGERDAETLYAYKRAGASVHDELDQAERRRFDMAASGQSPFDMSRQVGLELACTWNAFALQTLGDKMLEADEVADPDSVGFVPPVTFDQVQAYYSDVQRWLAHANRARHDGTFDLPVNTLPAKLPEWSPVEPCPRPHLDAMIAALKAMQLHAEAAMHALEKSTPEKDQAKLSRLRGLFAEAVSQGNYATNMYAPKASLALHEQVEELAKVAVEKLYQVGQYVSYPDLLLGQPQPKAGSSKPASGRVRAGQYMRGTAPLPGQAGFDPWVMTDPNSLKSLQRDNGVVRVINDMWSLDPNPRESLGLWEDIRVAQDLGAVDYARNSNGSLVGYYFCAPYAAIYEAKKPVVIGDTPVPKGQRFTIECAPEGTRIGYPFKREVVLGTFRAASIDYCDPDQPPPHDD